MRSRTSHVSYVALLLYDSPILTSSFFLFKGGFEKVVDNLRDCEPGGAEDRREDKDERCGRRTVRFGQRRIAGVPGLLAQSGEGTCKEHGDALAGGAPVQGPAATDAIEGVDTDEGGEHVEDIVEATDPLALNSVEAGDAEDGGRVDGDTGDADPLLQDLQPNDELHTSACMQVSRADAEQHVNIRVLLRLLGLEFYDLADVLVLSFSTRAVSSHGPPQPPQDVPGLLVTPLLD